MKKHFLGIRAYPIIFIIFLFAGCSEFGTTKKDLLKEKEDTGSFFDLTGGKGNDPNYRHIELIKPDDSGDYMQVKSISPFHKYQDNSSDPSAKESKPPIELDEKQKKSRMFNFSDAPFHQVVSLFAKEIGFKYLLTDDIKDKTTLFCEMELTDKEVWDIFRQVMNNCKVYYTLDSGLLVIRPMSDAGQTTTLQDDRTNLGVEVFRLQYLEVKHVAAQLAPFITKGVKIIELPSQNSIMVMDSKEVLEKVRQIVSFLDQPARHNWFKAIFPVHNVPSLRIAEELGQLLPVLGIPVVVNSSKESSEAMQIASVDRLQILIVSAPTKSALNEAKNWIERLDNNETGDQEHVYIYKVRNSKAESLTEILATIFNLEGTALVAESKTSESTGLTTTSKEIAYKGKVSNVAAASKGGAANPSSDSGAIFDTSVRVYADGVQNRLIIRTKPRVFTMIKAILDSLDTIPKQVLIQVLVVEVGLNDTTKFGVEFSMTDSKNNVGYLGGTNYKNLNPGSDKEYGGQFWLFNPKDPSQKYGYIQALSGMTNVKVLSSPQILVLSHNQAKFAVGNKVPLVNSEITNSQSVVTDLKDVSTNLVRNIQYQDTGIILKIIPQVTDSGQITFIMDFEVSEAVRNTTSTIDSPEIQNRTLNTTMMISDSQTIMCGGMIKEKITDNLDSIPVLDKIPFLRRLVGDTDYQKQRTEMLILITGTVIAQNTQLETLITHYKRSVGLLQEYHNKKSILDLDPERENVQNVESAVMK